MKKILLTGATGYIGGRLLSRLQTQDYEIVCFTRRPEALQSKKNSNTYLAIGDVQNVDDLKCAMVGVNTAFYLIHSMGDSGNFEEADRKAAINFATAAKDSNVKRIVYVGGLGDSDEELSSHLRSRQEVGQILKSSAAQIIEFRASIVIGSGSLSFELVRSLVDRLPILIMPKWVQVPAQPIWINDLLGYLVESINLKIEGNQIFEIGGTDVVSYREIMEEYARQRGLKRVMINVPVLTPYLSSLWLGLITPVFARTGRKLVNSLRHPTVVKDKKAKEHFNVKPSGLKHAVKMSLRNEDQEYAETHWADAISSAGSKKNYAGIRFGKRIVESHTCEVDTNAEQSFNVIKSIGGSKGWKYANWIWKLRGFIDLLVGGVGLRRGRPHPEKLEVGDVLDWWRVEQVVSNQQLLLIAEMKVPGRAWLKFEIGPPTVKGKKSQITQTAIFDPKGILGQLYWYSLFPIHALIFRGMIKTIELECNELATSHLYFENCTCSK